jgi:hypothetical protein
LTSHYNPDLKNAAIEELLSLLEYRTGHFDMINRKLENYQTLLSDDQRQRFTQLSARNTRDISDQIRKPAVELNPPM